MELFLYEGCPIHYRLTGPEEAPLVVLTHGGMVDHRIWDPQLAALTPSCRLLLWDVRGHGRSRPGGNRSIPQMAGDLAALLDHLGYRHAILVGLSAGGLLVQEFAYRYPNRVTALVVAGQTSWLRPPRELRLVLGSWSLTLLLFICLLLPWKLFLRGLMRHGAEYAMPQTQAYLQEAFGQWSKSRFIRHCWRSRGRLRNEPDYCFPQPLLIIHGEHEIAFVRRDAAAWAGREPQSCYKVIPGAGHVVNMDNPEAFNQALLLFLQEISRSAAHHHE
jgi:3-oxoadipate enol-lactonase